MKKSQYLIFLCIILIPSYTQAYKQSVHVYLTEAAVKQSALQSTSTALWSSWGISPDQEFLYQKTENDLHNNLSSTATFSKLLGYGADAEDTSEGLIWPASRAFSHFFNPQANKKLDLGPVYTSNFTSPDWILEYTNFGSPLNIPEQRFSYLDAQRYFYHAFSENTLENRNLNMGMMFQALGHVVHHVQDMAQPEHTRLDSHCDAKVCKAAYFLTTDDTSLYEKFTEELLVECNALTLEPSTGNAECKKLASYKGSYFVKKIYLGSYSPPVFNWIRDFWTTENWAGLADFSSGNFISTDTAYQIDPNVTSSSLAARLLPAGSDLPHPNRAESYVYPLPASTLFPGITSTDLSKINIQFIGVNATDGYTHNSVDISKMATFSIFTERLIRTYKHPRSIASSAIFSVNHVNLHQRAELLLPRAVGYSTGVINHFFKKRISAVQDGNGVLITNKSTVPISGHIELFYDNTDGKRWQSPFKSNRSPINLAAGESKKLEFVDDKPFDKEVTLLTAILTSELGFESNGTIAEAATRFTYIQKPNAPNCNATQVAGANTTETRIIELGKTSGKTTLTYDTFTVHDQIRVTYEGVLKFDSLCVGTNGPVSKIINYSGESSQMKVSVIPNCFGTVSTGWSFKLSCAE